MNIIAVDDEIHALELLKRAILKTVPNGSLYCFSSSAAALEHAKEYRVDIAFLDIRIDELNGLQLARMLKDIHNKINIIFVTGYNAYLQDAFQMHASGYVQKPVSAEDVAAELEELRHPVKSLHSRVQIQTFGYFEVIVDGKTVHFGRSKSKEILAYLVDRKGRQVSRKELAYILWEDEPYTRQKQKQLQTLIDEMKHALRQVDAENIVVQEKGRFYIDVDLVDCDYYRFDRWDTRAVNAYCGEYMVDYSWAEFTAGALSKSFFEGIK